MKRVAFFDTTCITCMRLIINKLFMLPLHSRITTILHDLQPFSFLFAYLIEEGVCYICHIVIDFFRKTLYVSPVLIFHIGNSMFDSSADHFIIFMSLYENVL